MKTEVNPHDTTRAEAFDLWMTSPMPMVTLTKTFDITTLMKASKRWDIKLNTLLCWCIGKAATQVDEFYLLPEQGRLLRFDIPLHNRSFYGNDHRSLPYEAVHGDLGTRYRS